MQTSRLRSPLEDGEPVWIVNPGSASVDIVDMPARVPHGETVRQLQAIGEVVTYVTKGHSRRIYAVAQIESRAAVENVAALAAHRGVDGFLIGPNDLAHSMGFGGDTRRPEVVAAIEHVASVLQRHVARGDCVHCKIPQRRGRSVARGSCTARWN